MTQNDNYNELVKRIKNKKVLITQSTIWDIAGSEIVTLELAIALRQLGAEVLVFTWALGGKMAKYFSENGIDVTEDENDARFSDCDYVWIHHEAIPEYFIKLMSSSAKKPYFIFFHMSGLKQHYMEQPYIYSLEEQIASKILFVSEEARDNTEEYYFNHKLKNAQIFPNPAPDTFTDFTFKNKGIKKVLVVSNHPTQELSNLNLGENIKIDYMGEGKETYSLLTPKKLKSYDVVVTIGKTVQYCLCMGIPVYVYDRFGGPGYLNDKNFEKCAYANFSGRGFRKKTTEEIEREIVKGFDDAAMFESKNIVNNRTRYGVIGNLNRVLRDLEKRKNVSDEFAKSLQATMCIVSWKFKHERRLQSIAENLNSERDQLISVQKELDNILSSKRYKMANALANIANKIRRR